MSTEEHGIGTYPVGVLDQVILGWALNGYVYANLDTPVEFPDDEPANGHQQPQDASVAANGASVGESDGARAEDAGEGQS